MTGSNETPTSEISSTEQPEDGSGDAVKISSQIQVVMRGKRIICRPRIAI
jgi:hypothetical protein